MNRAWLRWLISVAVLIGLLLWLDLASLAQQWQQLDWRYLGLALLVSSLQVVLSAWRWRFTANSLGLALPWRLAIGDYYLASFGNQVLPGGVLGDAWRADRHRRRSGKTGPAWRAVIIERASGQLVVALLSVPVLLALAGPAILLPLGLVLAMLLALGWLARDWPPLIGLLADGRLALLSAGRWPLQLGLSLVIVISYGLVFGLVGLGLGSEVGLGTLMLLALPALLAMLIPFSVAGWGWREAGSALAWTALGLSASEGVAIAMTYGAVIFLASLPGALVWLLSPAPR
ncbi:MAG: lysylphosphatidylglycerol synthase transmembrane domain-containing protein [Wenzhouxiangella sp.]